MKMQWFIDIIKDWVIAQGYATLTQVLAIASSVKDWVTEQNYTTLTEVLNTIQGTRFLAYRHDSIQTIPSGPTVRVAFNDVIFDTKSEWYQAGERLNIAQDGYYQISYSAGYRPSLGVDSMFQARLMVN
ncbi:unnamed protein product, partial [marine sediment metagenome]